MNLITEGVLNMVTIARMTELTMAEIAQLSAKLSGYNSDEIC